MSKITFLNNSKTKCSIVLCFFLILSSVVYAGDNKDVVTFNAEESSSDDFVNAFMGGKKSQELPEDLLPENAKPNTQMKFRGISLKKNTTKPEEQQKKEMEQQFSANKAANECLAGSQSVAVNVRFRTNSSAIKDQDTALLAKIAKAMNSSQLKNCYFVIEGHTDAMGEEYYNLWLSQKRADSVKAYLSQHKVATDRMVVVGKGEDELLNLQNPGAAENRRVQFKVINSAK